MKKLGVPVALSISGIGVGVLGIIMPIYIEAIKPWSNFILLLSLLLIFGPWLVMFVLSLRNKKGFKDPALLFDEINDSKLKAHVLFKVKECPNSGLIKDICLYRGDEDLFKYNIVVRAKNIDGFKSIKGFWGKEAPYVFSENFYEVYMEKPLVTFPHQDGSFWHDWNCRVISNTNELSKGDVDRESKWLLYKK